MHSNKSYSDNSPILFIVAPCFNEEDVLPETSKRLAEKIEFLCAKEEISEQSKIFFIDDGSMDNTWEIIEKYYSENPKRFGGIKLTKNKGHQKALLCGLLSLKSYCDMIISIDADLQDDINIIDEMVVKFKSGCEIVYGVRSDRNTDSFFKRTTALGFYSLMRLLGVDILHNHADFRLMGKRSLDALSEYGETNLFLRGIIPMIGYKTGIVYYSRAERFAGTSKYPLKKMLAFSFEGITSLSIKPIRMITWLGILIFCISIGLIVYFLFQHFSGFTITGWSSIIVSLWGIGGLVLLAIGIIGEYIGKIYLESKQRPHFHVEQVLK